MYCSTQDDLEKQNKVIESQMAKAQNMRGLDMLYDEIIVDLSTKYAGIGTKLEEVGESI